MALDYPSYSTIVNRSRVDIKKILKGLDPTIFESLVYAIIEANAGRHFDNVQLIKQLEKEIFPDTLTMQSAIAAQLASFYKNIVDFETTITEDKFKAVIANAKKLEEPKTDPEPVERLNLF